jgi:hypothetical protein
MKVKELIERLKNVDPEAELIMSKDAEGNSYSPLSDVEANTFYIPESTWCGQIYYFDSSADDNGMEEFEWAEFKKDKTRCVLLVPVN